MSASKPDEKMFWRQHILQGWTRKCLPQDEYWQFEKSDWGLRETGNVDAFICNCGQYCLFD